MTPTTTDPDTAERLGGMSSVRELAGRIQGQLLCPGDAGYESARRVFNAMIDRHPAVIIRCARAADVIEGIGFAQEHGLALAIKGGGH
ncbi:MAG: FAD-linked oxidase, partial [Solirubrobacteraceae bacterium]